MSHSSGCKDFDPKDYSWLSKNKYYLAVLALIVGPIIALGGKRFFPYIAAGVVSLAILFLGIAFCAIMGAFDTTVGLVFSLLASLSFAILAGCCLRRAFWLEISALGAVAGLIIGVVIYSILAVTFKFDSDIGFILSACFMGALGGIIAWRQKEGIVLYGSALIGSYILMRGIAAFYGGFPSHSEISKELSGAEDLEEPALFYLSIGILCFNFIVSASW